MQVKVYKYDDDENFWGYGRQIKASRRNDDDDDDDDDDYDDDDGDDDDDDDYNNNNNNNIQLTTVKLLTRLAFNHITIYLRGNTTP